MLLIRSIQPSDNPILAAIIRQAMSEFKADPKTTILGDPALNTMYENFQAPGAIYYIAELDGKMIGGSGIAHLQGSSENICELQRMFLKEEVRGTGVGKKLMELCLQKASDFGYDQIYIETLSPMIAARALYHKYGFMPIEQPLGSTGHIGCDIWLVKDLNS